MHAGIGHIITALILDGSADRVPLPIICPKYSTCSFKKSFFSILYANDTP